MMKFFKIVLLIAGIIFAFHLYNTNRDVRKAADSTVDATRNGVKTILKNGSDAL